MCSCKWIKTKMALWRCKSSEKGSASSTRSFLRIFKTSSSRWMSTAVALSTTLSSSLPAWRDPRICKKRSFGQLSGPLILMEVGKLVQRSWSKCWGMNKSKGSRRRSSGVTSYRKLTTMETEKLTSMSSWKWCTKSQDQWFSESKILVLLSH